MQDPNHHISDEDLLREADGELGASSAPVRKHLAACWTCRTRKSELEQGIVDFVHLYRRRLDPMQPPADGPRSLLRARLQEMEMQHTPAQAVPGGRAIVTLFTLRYAAPLLVLFVAIGLLLAQRLLHRHPRFDLAAAALPDAQITPGAARTVSRESVCRANDSDGPSVSNDVARQIFSRYAVRNARAGAYEIDYLIPPSLGGTPVAANLWPQPYDAGIWNSRVKDALEDRLESMVCAGTIDVAQAQRDLAGNWVAAYRRYFHSSQPLLDHLAFIKDEPWRGSL